MLNKYVKIGCFLLFALSVYACQPNNNHSTYGYIEGKLTYISSQVSGTLIKLNVEKGAHINQHQPLFQLDLNPQDDDFSLAKAKLIQAKANLANLEKGKRPTEIAAIYAKQKQITAKLVYAKQTVERYRKLYQQKVFDKSGLDEAVANYKNLQAQLTEANENLKTAKLKARSDEIDAAKAEVIATQAILQKATWQLNQKTITAPITGQVYDIYYRIGEVVPNNLPVLSLLSPHNIYAVFYIPEEQLATLKLNQRIYITCDECDNNITATISYISPQAEYTPPIIYSEKTRPKLVYRIEAKFSDKDALKLHPGQPISVNPSSSENHHA